MSVLKKASLRARLRVASVSNLGFPVSDSKTSSTRDPKGTQRGSFFEIDEYKRKRLWAVYNFQNGHKKSNGYQSLYSAFGKTRL